MAMGEEFLAEYKEVVEKVKADPASVDLRAFIRDELDGQLVGPMFNKIGRAFASYYYDDTHFTVIIEVNPSGTFYGWVFKFMGKIRILSPQSCVDKMQDIARTFI